MKGLSLLSLGLLTPWLLAQEITETEEPMEVTVPADPAEPFDPNLLEALKPSETELLKESIAYQKEEKYGLAINGYLDVLRYHPEGQYKEEVLFRVAECYRQLGRFKEARETLAILQKQFDGGIWEAPGFLLQSEMALAERKWKDALSPLEKAAQTKDPGIQIRAFYLHIIALENLKKLEDAEPLLQKLLAIKKDNPHLDYARLKLGVIYERKGQTKDALRLYQETLKTVSHAQMRAELAVRAGRILYANKSFKDAYSHFEIVRRTKAPEFWRDLAHLGLIQSSFALEDYKRVITIFNEVKPAFPESSREQLLFLIAESHRLVKNNGEALRQYDFIMKTFPEKPIAEASAWGRVLILQSSESADFIPETAKFIAKFPKSKRAFYVKVMRADAFFAKQQYKVCANMYAEITETPQLLELDKSVQAGIWLRLGQCHFTLKDFKRVVPVFQRIIKDFPKHQQRDTVLWLLGQALQETQNPKEAIKAWTQLLEEYPKFKSREAALWKTALLAGSLDDGPVMRKWMLTLLKEFPKTSHLPEAQYWIALSLTKEKKHEESLPYWKKARTLAPESYFAQATQQVISYALGKEDLETLILEVNSYDAWRSKHTQIKPIDLQVYEWIAFQLYEKKDSTRAISFFRRVVAQTTNQEQLERSQLILAQLLTETQNWGAAVEEWKAFQKNFPTKSNNPDVLLPLGVCLIGAVQFDEAKTVAEKILSMNREGPRNARGRILLGDVAFAKREYNEARRHYSSVPLLLRDDFLAPLALWKTEQSILRLGLKDKAKEVEEQRTKQFKDWTQPKSFFRSTIASRPEEE